MARLRQAEKPQPAVVRGMSSRRKLPRACAECKKPLDPEVCAGPWCSTCWPVRARHVARVDVDGSVSPAPHERVNVPREGP